MKIVRELMMSDRMMALNRLNEFVQIYDKYCDELNRLSFLSKHRYLYKLKELNLADTVINLTN